MPAPTTTMTAGDAERLADRLTRQAASETLAEQIDLMQAESMIAARLIRALLRHVSSSDVFTLPPA